MWFLYYKIQSGYFQQQNKDMEIKVVINMPENWSSGYPDIGLYWAIRLVYKTKTPLNQWFLNRLKDLKEIMSK
jgi:hypothetical protein